MRYDSAQTVTLSTIYDVASVTKIAATTFAVMQLVEQGKLQLDKSLDDYLPWTKGSDKAQLKIRDILLHEAGLKAWIPFYRQYIDTSSGQRLPGYFSEVRKKGYTIPVANQLYYRDDMVDSLYQRILTSALGAPRQYVYSDNDFIFLGKIVEAISGQTLDQYVKHQLYQPLQLQATGFLPLQFSSQRQIAPTEREKYFRLQEIQGYVHDPGAALFGGVAGHAGLFSTAADLFRIAQCWLNGGTLEGVQLLQPETLAKFTAYSSTISRRGLGFDKPEKNNAERKEAYPTLSASPGTFGHTGFTGTCVWVDPAKELVYIFLSNRVNPEGGDNNRLGQLNVRPNIHETIYKAIQ